MKWTRIVDDVTGLKKKDPFNPILDLERFIKKTLNEYTLDNITTKISLNDVVGGSGDYFIDQKKTTQKSILSRAEVLIRKRNVERYNTLLEYYRKNLEGKFPFVNYDNTQRTAHDADIDAVREFFKMYVEYGGTPEKILDQIYQLKGDTVALHEFLKKIHELWLFLGDALINDESIKVCVEVNFNINPKEEANTDYLVDKIVKTSTDTNIEPINKDKTGIWYYGEPFECSFRFASDDTQADRPVSSPNDPDLLVQGSKATVQCVGAWSLIRFLQKYQTQTGSVSMADKNQSSLEFKLPLSSAKDARVFIGIIPMRPKKPGEPTAHSVKAPPIPGKMPEIPGSVMSSLSDSVLVSEALSNGVEVSREESPEKEPDEPESTESKKKESHVSGISKAAKPAKNERLKPASKPGHTSKDKTAQEVKTILKSNDDTKEDDTIIAVNEEPIE
jgi:hypothetical protein